MNGFAATLVSRLAHKHLLKHPFYQAWTAGELSQETLGTYARQYYQHVLAFPRYVSAVHANCEDQTTRQALLENLISEDRGEKNHPELWLRFAEGLGQKREDVKAEKAHMLPETSMTIAAARPSRWVTAAAGASADAIRSSVRSARSARLSSRSQPLKLRMTSSRTIQPTSRVFTPLHP